MTDVDAQLQRRRGDERLELARFQPVFGVEPFFLRQASVMRGDSVFPKAVGKVTGEAFGQPPRVDEDQCGAMLGDELRQTVVVLLPHFVRHHRFERRAGDLDGQVHRAAMTFIDDLCSRGL